MILLSKEQVASIFDKNYFCKEMSKDAMFCRV
jgi:hypothetical protein